MKNSYYVVILCALFLFSSARSHAQWVKCTALPGDAPVLTTAQLIYIASNGTRIFTTRGSAVDSVFYSDDNGASWAVSLMPGLVLGGHTYYPSITGVWAFNGTIFVSGTQGGVTPPTALWRSSDNGQTWTKSSVGLTGTPVVLFASGNTMYAGTATAGIFLSTDAGATWSAANTGIPKYSFVGITFYVNVFTFAAIGNDLFVGLGGDVSGNAYGIRHTTVGSSSWDSLGAGLPVKTIVPSIIAVGTTLYCRVATYAQGVYKSTDNGANWVDVTNSVPARNNLGTGAQDFFVYGNTLFSGTISGDYTTTNGGAAWTAMNGTGLPSTYYFNGYTVVGSTLFATAVDASTFPTTSAVWKRSLSQITAVQELPSERPTEFVLGQNYPNPFNPTTRISFELSAPSTVTLKVYSMIGQEVAVLLDQQHMNSGKFEIPFDASQLASGVYMYHLSGRTEDGSGRSLQVDAVRKMSLVR